MRRGLLNKPEEFNVTIQPFFLMDKKCREFSLIYDIQEKVSICFIAFFGPHFQRRRQKLNSTNVLH